MAHKDDRVRSRTRSAVRLAGCLVIAFACAGAAGCAGAPTTLPPGMASEIAEAKALVGTGWPASGKELATTDGAIYSGNLDAQIDTLAALQKTRTELGLQPRLAGLLYHRFQMHGRLGDAEEAAAIMAAADRAGVLRPDDRLVYARILAGFHDFVGVERQLAAAEAQGAAPAAIADARASLRRALELPDAVIPNDPPTDYISAVQRAALHVDRGELVEATALLRLAQSLYQDSSPFPLAWIHVQQGIAFLRFEQYEEARIFFAAAHARLPQYFLATEHLAETEGLLGNARRSVELYREVTAQNDQPAFWHGLAEAEAALGRTAAAAEAASRAAAGYQTLLAKHRLMYADHAVGYYLDSGDITRALELARENYLARRDVNARLALAEALMASGNMPSACEHVTELRSAGLAPPETLLSSHRLSRCPST